MTLKQIVTSDLTSLLRRNVGRTIKPVLMFDINRILRFDVSWVLFWQVPPVMLRALAGWLTAAVLLAVAETWAAQRGLHAPDRAALLVMIVCVVGFTGWRAGRAFTKRD
jgi:hypothetical protein